jgi:uncharacterized membrane protein
VNFIPIDLANPLIVLRVYLAIIWILPVLYGVKALRSLPRKSPYWPSILFSVLAALCGAASYFIGASTTFTSGVHFIWVGALLGFTPVALITWFHIVLASEKRKL